MANKAVSSHGVYIVFETQLGSTKLRRSAVRVESFQFDTSLDTDADTFTVSIGTPKFGLSDIVSMRDEELKVTLYLQSPTVVGGTGQVKLFTGFVDIAVLTSDGVLQLQGRDVSSIAADSQPEPVIFRNLRPDKKFAKEALDLGFDAVRLNRVGVIPRFFRDGNETYWENWYRAFRKFKNHWLWCEPDGTLVADTLGYTQDPSYFFGLPPLTSADPDFGKNWNNILELEFTKNVTTRVGKVVLWYTTPKQVIKLKPDQVDPTIDSWIKKPQRIIVDSKSSNQAEAKRVAWEEINDGRVGAQEITITVPYTGVLYKQNKMCRINIPQMDIAGVYFVVGINFAGSEAGFTQQLRLRQKDFALTVKKPDDPETLAQADPYAGGLYPRVNFTVPGSGGPEMGGYFTRAATTFHENIDYDLYLATLLAIADQESGFSNEIEGTKVVWYAPPEPGTQGAGAASRSFGEENFARSADTQGVESLDDWHKKFQNEKPKLGVGIMQLTDIGAKQFADDDFKQGYHDQYLGGRWKPRSNIYAGAWWFNKGIPLVSSDQNAQIFSALVTYNGGPVPNAQSIAYANAVYKRIHSVPNWLKTVQQYRVEVDAAQIGLNTYIETTSGAPGLFPATRLTGLNLLKKIQDLVAAGEITIENQGAKKDIQVLGSVDQNLLQCILHIHEAKWPITISAIKSDHTIDVFENGYDTGRKSLHGLGLAFDNNHFSVQDGRVTLAECTTFEKWLYDNRIKLYLHEIIGPDPYWCWKGGDTYDPEGGGTLQGNDNKTPYPKSTLDGHKNHVHLAVYPSGR